MSEIRVERAFLTLAGRQVHYRRAGSGPAVVLLHQSPKSSEELIPMMRLLAPYFTVLAPDTPGYGLSDPIAPPDSEPEMDVFADAVAEFFDGMGLKRAGVYGFHTGAAIGTRFAARYPERVAALVPNGTLIKTPEERADFLANYLPPFIPSWDGAHLAWAWSRMKEQVIFFPWYKRDPSARIAGYPITLDGLQANTLALLQAGDNYRTAYRTAFTYAVEEDLRRIAVPARFVCAESDPLFRYLDRFPPLPANARIVPVPDAGSGLDLARDFLREMSADCTVPAIVPTAPMPRKLSSRLVDIPSGQIHVRLNMDGSGRPVIVIHPPGGSARALQPFLGGFIGARPVYAPDLPGHGDSDGAADGEPIAAAVTALGQTMDGLGIAEADVIVMGDSAAIGAAWAAAEPGRIASLTLCDFLPAPADRAEEFVREMVPDLTPDWAGGHLLKAWHAARDQDLFWPWFDKSPAAGLADGVPASDQHVQQRVIDLFKAEAIHTILAAAILQTDAMAQLSRLPQPIHVFVSPGRPTVTGLATPVELPTRALTWAPIILAALAHS
jgi:pimeloyl-ACP methyl ester carboxylesterase